jgi:hypothetical protein
MKVPEGRIVSKATLIAISNNNGKKWYFVDTAGKDFQTMRKTFPNLNEGLIIPEKERPVLYNN